MRNKTITFQRSLSLGLLFNYTLTQMSVLFANKAPATQKWALSELCFPACIFSQRLPFLCLPILHCASATTPSCLRVFVIAVPLQECPFPDISEAFSLLSFRAQLKVSLLRKPSLLALPNVPQRPSFQACYI